MKKITFLVASILLFGGNVANASEKNSFSHENSRTVNFRNPEPIVFTERGVEFFVFPDGQFDFNTRPLTGGRNAYYKAERINAVNRTYGAPSNFRNENYGVKVEHDNFGRVRRIGNVFINYDANDRIKRVGSVYISYNRYALEQVGGLQIIYNRRGQIIDRIGSVKGHRAYENNFGNYEPNYGGYQNNNDDDDRDDNDGNNQNSEDHNHYYYKNGTVKAQKEVGKAEENVDLRIDKRR